MQARLAAAAARVPHLELHIRSVKAVRYERVAKAMDAAQRAGMHKVSFITDLN